MGPPRHAERSERAGLPRPRAARGPTSSSSASAWGSAGDPARHRGLVGADDLARSLMPPARFWRAGEVDRREGARAPLRAGIRVKIEWTRLAQREADDLAAVVDAGLGESDAGSVERA